MNLSFSAVLVAALFAAPAARADETHHKPADAAAPGATAGMADGEIRKVDKDAQKITIKHGPLPNVDMPAMTMVFQVQDPAMLEQVKAGDKVKFLAERIDGGFTVTKIEPVK